MVICGPILMSVRQRLIRRWRKNGGMQIKNDKRTNVSHCLPGEWVNASLHNNTSHSYSFLPLAALRGRRCQCSTITYQENPHEPSLAHGIVALGRGHGTEPQRLHHHAAVRAACLYCASGCGVRAARLSATGRRLPLGVSPALRLGLAPSSIWLASGLALSWRRLIRARLRRVTAGPSRHP